jgi:hypothetical protein
MRRPMLSIQPKHNACSIASVCCTEGLPVCFL